MKNLINIDHINYFFASNRMNAISEDIIDAFQQKLDKPHGDVARWQTALSKLPAIEAASLSVNDGFIRLTGQSDFNNEQLTAALKAFCPWRKGPFSFLGTSINTEWDSLMKWNRVQESLKEANVILSDKNVLDVGCGNGAFMWPILQAGAKSVTGVDPMWLFYHQFMVFQRYIRSKRLCFLPLGVQDLPLRNSFGVVLSMGVLYHRKSPLDHLFQLKGLLKKGGNLIIETIVLPDQDKQLLTPRDRYAGMRNVWMIPSVTVLQDWLIKVGFELQHTSTIVKTTFEEQRQSEWMDFHSLNQFLNTENEALTTEGHPAPYRVIIVAKS